MPQDDQNHHRRSVRLPGYDYAQIGVYFVTVVTWQREHLFGKIVNGEMRLSKWGFVAENEWRRLAIRFPGVQLDEFVIMPNHMHGIICIGMGDGADTDIRARQQGVSMPKISSSASPLQVSTPLPNTSPLRGSRSGTLGAIIGAYKATTARLINALRRTPASPVWQRNFFERIIRDEREWETIQAYIEANPANWIKDEENL